MSDALTIARWCWPSIEAWVQDGDASPACSCEKCVGFQFRSYDSDDHCPSGVRWYGVAAAESILIERGLAWNYGDALAAILFADPRSNAMRFSEQFTMFATAPLAARVRAMAAVIRAQEAKP